MSRFLRFGLPIVTLILLTGCPKPVAEFEEKAPRPVTVITLEKTPPRSSYFVSGQVSSWKTEQIGFEVAGRVLWALEPGANIIRQIKMEDGTTLYEGTELARIDPSRYQVAVESRKAALEVAQLDKEVADLEYGSLPTEIQSAQTNFNNAVSELERMQNLRTSGAVSEFEVEQAENAKQSAEAQLNTLQANLSQSEQRLKSAVALVRSAQQALEDAERDLENTTLRASYQGQIAEVHVVPGSVVNAGSPVLTLQMMDPIKVEIEVSAEQAREIEKRRQLPVTFNVDYANLNSEQIPKYAFVYMVDPSADPSTRTFTITLFIMNQKARPQLPEAVTDLHAARTRDLWPLKLRSIITSLDLDEVSDQDHADSLQAFANSIEGSYLVEENSVHTDENGDYVWLIDGIELGDPMPDLKFVKRQEVQASDLRIPFLGNWVFRQITFPADAEINDNSLVAGKLEFYDVPEEEWLQQTEKAIFVDSGFQWMLRPGDLVNVDLSNSHEARDGYYVPVEAIYEELGTTYVFIVDGDKVVKTEVAARLGEQQLETGESIRIEPVTSTDFPAGTQIVLGGVHFLADGDNINVVETVALPGVAPPSRAGQMPEVMETVEPLIDFPSGDRQ